MSQGLRSIAGGAALVVALVASGCDPGSFDASDGGLEVVSFRGGGGIWIGNGLESPLVSIVSTSSGLSTVAGMDPNGAQLGTALGVESAAYLVECALPAGQSITKVRSNGQTFVFPGLVGLAPQWQNGACDQSCQEWVSACMLARINVTGQTLGLWLSADHPAIGLNKSNANYPLYEATFYGNLFQNSNARHLCRGDADEQIEVRTCGGLDPTTCGFTAWGDCDEPQRCDRVAGHETNCATGANPTAGTRFKSISVYVEDVVP